MWAYDRRLCARAVAACTSLATAAWTVIVLTDEAGSSAAMRVARLCALAPLLQILALLWVLASARRRGEERALMALGVSPLRVARGALFGAWLVGGFACVGVGCRWADPSSLFPALESGPAWSLAGGSWTHAFAGVSVGLHSGLQFTSDGSAQAPAQSRRVAAVLAVLPLVALAPLWAALRCTARARLLVGCSCAAFVVCLLHAVAARRVAELHLIWGALPLGLHSLWLERPRRPPRNARPQPKAG